MRAMTPGATKPLATAAEVTATPPKPQATIAATREIGGAEAARQGEKAEEEGRHGHERQAVDVHVEAHEMRPGFGRHQAVRRRMEGHHDDSGEGAGDEQDGGEAVAALRVRHERRVSGSGGVASISLCENRALSGRGRVPCSETPSS